MKLLIVEHESLLALALAEQLRLAGHTIVGPSYDFGEAMDLATSQQPQLAIVDIEIGNVDERTRLVWSLSGSLGIPSILLTSRREYTRQCEGAAMAVLEKPFRVEDIVPTVDAARDRLPGHARPYVPSRGYRIEQADSPACVGEIRRRDTHLV